MSSMTTKPGSGHAKQVSAGTTQAELMSPSFVVLPHRYKRYPFTSLTHSCLSPQYKYSIHVECVTQMRLQSHYPEQP